MKLYYWKYHFVIHSFLRKRLPHRRPVHQEAKRIVLEPHSEHIISLKLKICVVLLVKLPSMGFMYFGPVIKIESPGLNLFEFVGKRLYLL